MVENFDEFFEGFYEPQFEWYDSKAVRNKWLHRVMKVAQIALASVLPVAVTLFPVTSSTFWKNMIIITAVLLIILEALESYLNYQKKWMNYRTTAEGCDVRGICSKPRRASTLPSMIPKRYSSIGLWRSQARKTDTGR